MDEYYNYLTSQGVIVPDTSTILTNLQQLFQSVFGSDIDTSPETPQGRLIELWQRNRTFTLEICAAVSNMLNLNKANGFFLDDLGALFLLSRKAATYTTTTVIMSGVAGTVIPANTRLQTQAGDIFVNTESYVIGDGGSVQATYQAQQSGPVPATPNTMTIILDPVNGLETVNNPANATLGIEQESDNAFRNRIKASLNVNALTVISAIKSGLENLDGVDSTYCYDNYDSSSVVIDGLTVPAHSVLAVVDGGDPAQIAQVLYSKKTLGTGYISETGNSGFTIVTETVIDPSYGTSYDVTFARPTYTPIYVTINVLRSGYSGDDLTTAIQNAIVAFANGENPEVDGLGIGSSVSPFEISAAVSSTIPDIFINSVTVGTQSGSQGTTTLNFGYLHKPTISATNITVNIEDDQ